MNKLISFIALVACAIIALIYLANDNNSPTNESKKQKLQQTDKGPLTSPIPDSDRNIETSQPQNDSDHTTPPATLSKKPIVTDARPKPVPYVEPAPETTEEDYTNSYPIEDAEIYFVPPEQRYPGNLGGPPPLILPNQED